MRYINLRFTITYFTLLTYVLTSVLVTVHRCLHDRALIININNPRNTVQHA